MRGTIAGVVALAVCALSSLGRAEEKRIDLAAIITKADAQTALGDLGPLSGPSLASVVKANAFVIIGISGIDDEKVATEKARMLAKKILGKL